MQPRVPGGDDGPAFHPGIAVPVGEDSASALNDRDQRCDIPLLQPGFDDEIDEAHCEQRVGITITAVARETTCPFDTKKPRALFIPEMGEGMSGADYRIRKFGRAPSRSMVE